jgi:site-specific DNA-methyltransferase (adenine-specific)
MTPADYLAWTNQWLGACSTALKPDGALWLVIGDEWAADMIVRARGYGLHLRNWCVWHYTFGQHMKTKFTRSHAHCLHFVKNPKKHTFNFKDVAVPSARAMIYKDARAAQGGRCPDDVWILRPQWFPEGFTEQHDTWFIPRLCGTFKEKRKTPNQLPEQLVARMIAVASNPGDVVLDPMAGSGTVPIVAKKLGRKPMGFELSKAYAAAAQKALDAVTVGNAIS